MTAPSASWRVLLLNYEFPPMGGGAGHASFQIARGLVARGHQVDVVTSGIAGQPSCEWVHGVRVFRVQSRRRNIQDCGLGGASSYLLGAGPIIRRLARQHRYHLVHYFFGLPTGVLSLAVPELRSVPSVISLRGSDVPGYDVTNRTLQRLHCVLKPVTRAIWRRADAVVALSESLRVLASQTLPDKPIEVIPNGIGAEQFRPNGQHRHDLLGRPLQVLTVARLVQRKGLDGLLRAIALLRNVSLQLTIQGSGRAEAFLQQLAVSLGIADRVIFSGFRAREFLPPVYQAADVFVMPSRSESFGLAVLEAMACGLPVIVSRVGGMVDFVEDGVNGLVVPPDDPGRLAEAIRRLAHDPALRARMGRRNAEQTRSQYTWEGVVEAYVTVYDRLAPRANGRGTHASA